MTSIVENYFCRLLVLLSSLLLTGCVSGFGIDRPVASVQLLSDTGGPEGIYWDYFAPLESLSLKQRADHLKGRGQVLLPVVIQAEPFEFLWVVAVCNGTAGWNKARRYQATTDSPVRIKCPN